MEFVLFILALLIGLFVFYKMLSLAVRLFILVIGISLLCSLPSYFIDQNNDFGSMECRNYWSNLASSNIADALEEKRVVFVALTNNNCLTCKLNNFTTLRRSEFVDFAIDYDILLIQDSIDISEDSLPIPLRPFDLSSPPVYIVFSPAHPHGRVIDKLLTPSYVLEELKTELSADSNSKKIKRIIHGEDSVLNLRRRLTRATLPNTHSIYQSS